jgi:hypothetical protein
MGRAGRSRPPHPTGAHNRPENGFNGVSCLSASVCTALRPYRPRGHFSGGAPPRADAADGTTARGPLCQPRAARRAATRERQGSHRDAGPGGRRGGAGGRRCGRPTGCGPAGRGREAASWTDGGAGQDATLDPSSRAVPGAGRPSRRDLSDAEAERADPGRVGGEERACGLLVRGSLPSLPVLRAGLTASARTA